MVLLQLVLLYLLFDLTYIAVALFYVICLKLKSDLINRIFPTIQEPYVCVYCNSAIADASDAMKPERFASGNFRRWQTRVKFWHMSMGLWWVIHAVMPFTLEQTTAFSDDSDTTLRCIISLLSYQLYNMYTELWDALESKYTVTCEQFYDFSIDATKSIVA